MSDSYQAIYDAVRSRIGGGDIGQAVENTLREVFGMADHHMRCVAQSYESTAYEQQRPSVLMRPVISIDGDQWCALYGDNLQDGVAGFGDSPELAMYDFDKNWNAKLSASPLYAAQPVETVADLKRAYELLFKENAALRAEKQA